MFIEMRSDSLELSLLAHLTTDFVGRLLCASWTRSFQNCLHRFENEVVNARLPTTLYPRAEQERPAPAHVRQSSGSIRKIKRRENISFAQHKSQEFRLGKVCLYLF